MKIIDYFCLQHNKHLTTFLIKFLSKTFSRFLVLFYSTSSKDITLKLSVHQSYLLQFSFPMFITSIQFFPCQQFRSEFCLFSKKTLAKVMQAIFIRKFHRDSVVICDFIKKEVCNCGFNYIFSESDEGVSR